MSNELLKACTAAFAGMLAADEVEDSSTPIANQAKALPDEPEAILMAERRRSIAKQHRSFPEVPHRASAAASFFLARKQKPRCRRSDNGAEGRKHANGRHRRGLTMLVCNY